MEIEHNLGNLCKVAAHFYYHTCVCVIHLCTYTYIYTYIYIHTRVYI